MGLNSERFQVRGYVRDIRKVYDESAVMAVPILTGAGIRTKIVESMSMNTPVVSTTIGCEGMPVTDGTDILIADTPVEFAKKTIDLLNDESLREKIASNAFQLAKKHYDIDAACDELVKAYALALRRKRSQTTISRR
jgi:polysaccharide biosynthesis protein PslH